jgi:hypothetical protein
MKLTGQVVVAAGALFVLLAGVVASGCGGGGDCDTYCTTVMKNCTEAQGVYVSMDVCLAVCADLPVGTSADVSGDTVGCRTYYAKAAATNPTEQCPRAGPGGAGYCGTNCEGYCDLALAVCPSVYKSEADCQAACKGFPEQEPYSAELDLVGNTVECRLYHESVATLNNYHCAHIGPNPTPGTCTGVAP